MAVSKPSSPAPWWLVLAAAIPFNLYADNDPVPGVDFPDPAVEQQEFLRQLERQRQLDAIQPEVVIEGLRREDDYRLPDQGPSFRLLGIRFSRSEILTQTQLRDLSGDYVGKEVDFPRLNELVDRINKLYDLAGFVTARAVIPPQEINEGIVYILLLEGRLGQLQLAPMGYTEERFVLSRLNLPAPGEVLDVMAVQEDLTRFNSIYELDILASLQPGEQFGETDLLLLPQERPRWALNAFADNAGSRTTGRERVGLTGTLRGPLARDDRLFAYLAGASSSLSGSLSYSVPVNQHGGRLEATASANDIEVTKGPFQALEIEGRSYTADLAYRHPLLRQDDWAVDGVLRTAYTDSRTDYLGGLELSKYRLMKNSAGLNISHRGRLQRVSLAKRVTHVDAHERLDDDTQGYFVWTGNLDWLQYLGSLPLYTQLSGNWQITNLRDLPSSDLYQAGGMYTVRGYEQNVMTGARGYNATLQVNWQAHRNLTPYVYLDHASAQSVSPRNESIDGAGVGISWRWTRYASGQLDYGRALNRIEADQDRDQIHFRINLGIDSGPAVRPPLE
ncbi:MAG: hypothetical protein LAT63_11855 [Marinobacter sp.]|nr:hypothetical protein [Marinobacter sp.]